MSSLHHNCTRKKIGLHRQNMIYQTVHILSITEGIWALKIQHHSLLLQQNRSEQGELLHSGHIPERHQDRYN
jgi:hypothetical protein